MTCTPSDSGGKSGAKSNKVKGERSGREWAEWTQQAEYCQIRVKRAVGFKTRVDGEMMEGKGFVIRAVAGRGAAAGDDGRGGVQSGSGDRSG